MIETEFAPTAEFRKTLDAATPVVDDFVLYCKMCLFVGQTNAAHYCTSRCPNCGELGIRVWKHTTSTHFVFASVCEMVTHHSDCECEICKLHHTVKEKKSCHSNEE